MDGPKIGIITVRRWILSSILTAGMWVTGPGSAAAVSPSAPSSILPLPYGWRPLPWAPPSPAAARLASGLRVAIDPVTGTLGSPTPETRVLAIESDVVPIRVDVRPDGSQRSFVDDRMMEYTVVDFSAGLPRWSCLSSKAAADTVVLRGRDVRMPAPGTKWVTQ